MTVRVLIADDQELVRTGFAMILARDPGIEVVAQAVNGQEAVLRTRESHPDVVLMDVRMPILDGLQATRRLVADATVSTRVVILTTFDHDEYLFEALAAGASGFLLKDAPAADLLAAVHIVAGGDALLAPTVTQRVIAAAVERQSVAADAERVAALSPRERDVLRLMAEGMANSEIADRLVVGHATVKTHVAHVLQKLGARDRVQAVVAAYRAGLPYAAPD
jgi:DNA-binding NarL/FixJ family response regulator